MNSYIYLIQDDEFINTNIYKVSIGKILNENNIKKLIKLKYLRQINFNQVNDIKKKIKKIFKNKFKHIKENKWFEGNYSSMVNTINCIIDYFVIDDNLETVNLETVNLETVNLETVNLETVNLETVNLETVNLETSNIKININELTNENWYPRDNQDSDEENDEENDDVKKNIILKFDYEQFIDGLKITYNISNILFDDIKNLPLSHNEITLAQYISKKYYFKTISYYNDICYIYENYKWNPIKNGKNKINKIIHELSIDYEKLSLYYCLNIEKTNNIDFINKSYEYGKIAFKLKRNNNFKNNILKECIKLYYDDTFIEKLDKNNNLLHFLNGVYDLQSNELREGSPDDFISLSTNINFIQELNNDFHEKVDLVNEFLNLYHKIFINFLANLLNSGYKIEFHKIIADYSLLYSYTYLKKWENILKNIDDYKEIFMYILIQYYQKNIFNITYNFTNNNIYDMYEHYYKKCYKVEDFSELTDIYKQFIEEYLCEDYNGIFGIYEIFPIFKKFLNKNAIPINTKKYNYNEFENQMIKLIGKPNNKKQWKGWKISPNNKEYNEEYNEDNEDNKDNDEIKKKLNDIDEIDIYKQFIEEYFRKDTNTTLCINEVFLIFKGFLRQCGINIKKYNHRVFENCMSKIIGKPNNKKKWKGWKIAPNQEEEDN